MAGDYSSEDILRMQQDAARRVREMQARSRFAVEHSAPHAFEEPNEREKAETQPKQPQEAVRKSGENVHRNTESSNAPKPHAQQSFLPFPVGKKGGILEVLHTNSDTVLLMALLFVLYTEQADELLMLAVLYIML